MFLSMLLKVVHIRTSGLYAKLIICLTDFACCDWSIPGP